MQRCKTVKFAVHLGMVFTWAACINKYTGKVWWTCYYCSFLLSLEWRLRFWCLFLSLLLLFVSVNVIALATRMKQANDRRERLAARQEERKEKEEKWKHGHKQEKVKKQNPKDALKRKVEYITMCEGNMHFCTTCINFCIVGHV